MQGELLKFLEVSSALLLSQGKASDSHFMEVTTEFFLEKLKNAFKSRGFCFYVLP